MSDDNKSEAAAPTSAASGAGISRPCGRWSLSLLSFCLAFVFVRLPFIFTVPMQEAPDEFNHYWVIRFLKDNLRLPSAQEVAAAQPSSVYASLPQMGYLPHLLVALPVSESNIALFARFGSLLAGTVLLYAAFRLGRYIFPGSRLLSTALPVAVIFHPQLAFVHSYSNNDSTAAALTAACLLLAVQCIVKGVSLRAAAALGVLVGWLALSKYTGLAVLPALALALAGATILHKVPPKKAFQGLALCLGLFMATTFWWFIRNYYEFGGDILGTRTMYKAWAIANHRQLVVNITLADIAANHRWWRFVFFSFWGMFGFLTVYLHRLVYIMYGVFTGAGALGALALLVGWCKKTRSSMAAPQYCAQDAEQDAGWQRRPAMDLSRRKQTLIWLTLSVSLAVNLAAMIWSSMQNFGGAQGRYLFPSELPFMAILLAGLHKFGGKYGDRLVVAFLVFNALVCLGAWLMLFKIYGFHGHPF